jgi:hypothetical protein
MQNQSSTAQNTSRGEKATLGFYKSSFDAQKEVEEAVIEYAELPSIQIAERVALDAPESFRMVCASAVLLRLVRAIRRAKQRAEHEQYRLPGMEYFPLKIKGKRGRLTELLDATYADVRIWEGRLSVSRQTAKRRHAKALLDLMAKASKKTPGITVRRAIELYGPIPEVIG